MMTPETPRAGSALPSGGEAADRRVASPVPTPEDAQAFYDACRFRFEQQERVRDRFAARVQQLVVVATGLGGGAVYLGDISLAQHHLPVLQRLAWVILLLQVIAVAMVIVSVSKLFWSTTYKRLPDKMVYEQVWTEAEHYHQANAGQGLVVPRKSIILPQMARGFLDAVEHNTAVDDNRQRHLDSSKLWAAVAAVLFGVGLVLSFAIKLSAASQ